jgi:hypothetical protein
MQTPDTNKSNDDVKAAKPPAEPPTTKHSGYEDNAEHVVIDRLLYQAAVEAKEIVYSGTDYGVCTQSTTTRMTPQRFDAHLRLYNRFQALADDDCQDCVEVAVLDREECHRITSGEISQMSLVRYTARRREKRKVGEVFLNS